MTVENTNMGFEYAMKSHRACLKLVGIWPYTDNRFSNAAFSFFFTWQILILTALTIHITSIKDYQELMQQILVTAPVYMCILKYILAKIATKRLKAVIEYMLVDWSRDMSEESREIMLRYARKANRINAIICGFILVSTVLYVLAPIQSRILSGLPWNMTERKLPSGGIFPFDAMVSPYYEIVYIFQGLGGYFTALIFYASDFFLIVAVFHGCGQYAVLARILKTYTGDFTHVRTESTEIYDCACLRCIVERHVSVINYMELVNSFDFIMLLQLVGNSFMLAVAGYIVVAYLDTSYLVGFIINVVYTLAITYGIFVFCYIGECSLQLSEEIGSVAYNLNWETMPRNTALPLVMLIIRSRSPSKMTAGKFAVMSLMCYKSIITTCLSYISVLRAIK